MTAIAAGFRLRPGGGPFRSGCDSLNAALRPPLHFPRSSAADRSRSQFDEPAFDRKLSWQV